MLCALTSVVDPKLLAGYGYGTGKNHFGSGQLRIRNEFKVKTSLKSTKMLN
jgi:hypothetical protein